MQYQQFYIIVSNKHIPQEAGQFRGLMCLYIFNNQISYLHAIYVFLSDLNKIMVCK